MNGGNTVEQDSLKGVLLGSSFSAFLGSLDSCFHFLREMEETGLFYWHSVWVEFLVGDQTKSLVRRNFGDGDPVKNKNFQKSTLLNYL